MKFKKLTTILLVVPIISGTIASTTLSAYASNTTTKSTTSTSSKVKNPSVKINKSSLTLNVGQSAQLSASISPANKLFKSITWQSANTKIATVDKNGKVLGKKAGKTNIYAMAKSSNKSNVIYATCTVTVTAPSNNTTAPSANSKIEDAYMLVLKDIIDPRKPNYLALDLSNDIKNNKNFVTLIENYSKTLGFKLLFDNYEGLKSKGYVTPDIYGPSGYGGNFNGGVIMTLNVKSNANNKLVIDTGYFCGSLCAEGRTYTLEKINGSYKIISSNATWVS